jgi:dihydrodipicolinate synthase/N-acetylneuraminate lyase
MQSQYIKLPIDMLIKKRFQGIVVPLVTPLTEKFTLDVAAVEKIHEHITKSDCMPFILGTTGEAASLPLSLKLEYLKVAAKLKGEYQDLYAGIGSNCLHDSIELAKRSFDIGADVVVATLPSWYNLTDIQMQQYFEQLAEAVDGPLMIYNIPATTNMSIPLKVIDALSHHENIVGVKDSERSEERMNQSLALWAARADFSYFLGWAARSAAALEKGCDGIVPSTANLEPGLYQLMYLSYEQGSMEQAYILQELSDQLGNMYQAGKTLGESLAALKALMKCHALCDTYMMPPLERISTEEEKRLRNVYAEFSE